MEFKKPEITQLEINWRFFNVVKTHDFDYNNSTSNIIPENYENNVQQFVAIYDDNYKLILTLTGESAHNEDHLIEFIEDYIKENK